MKLHYTVLYSFLLGVANAASTFTPARPPAILLAVKSPYFSTWQQQAVAVVTAVTWLDNGQHSGRKLRLS
jgi:hypothetical protein